MKDEMKVMHMELMQVCQKHLECIPEEVKPLDIVKMMQDYIKVLTLKKKLEELEEKTLKRFKDIFKPILHNAEKTIMSRSYPCL